MKQIWPDYSYSPATNVLTLTGLNIDRDQLLLVTAADRGRIMYNFADSSVTASAFTSGANTALTLVATTAGLTTTAALVIYYDDQLASTTVTVSSLPAISGTVTANGIASNEGEGVPDKAVWIAYNESNNLQGVGSSTPLPISGTVTAFVSDLTNATENYDEAINQSVIAIHIKDLAGNVLGTSVSPMLISGTVTANPTGTQTIAGSVTLGASTAQIGSVTASISGTVPVSGTFFQATQPVSLTSTTVTVSSLPALVAGTANIGVVTVGNIRRSGDGALTQLTTEVGSGALQTVIGAGTAQIGSVTASISGTVPISISSVTVGNSVTIGSLPAISGTVTANTFALQGTAVTTSNFTSTTASTVLANFNATREVLTIFNEGAGNLHICAGATCTTIAYQVRLSAGDYYEVPNHQTTITHSAVFATAGTARVCQVS
jgi:hypothetical protein